MRCVDMDSEATSQLKVLPWPRDNLISLFSWLLRNMEPLVKYTPAPLWTSYSSFLGAEGGFTAAPSHGTVPFLRSHKSWGEKQKHRAMR